MLCIAQLFVILNAQFQRLCYLPMRPSEQIMVGLPSLTGLSGHLLGLPSTPAAAVARRLPLGWMRLRVAVPGLVAHRKTGVQQHSAQYLVVGTPFTVAIHPSLKHPSCEGGARWEERGDDRTYGFSWNSDPPSNFAALDLRVDDVLPALRRMVQWNDRSGYPGLAPSILHHNCGIKTANGQSSVKATARFKHLLSYYARATVLSQADHALDR